MTSPARAGVRRGFAITGCLLFLCLMYLLLFVLVPAVTRGGRGSAPAQPTPALDVKAEFTARDGLKKYAVSRKQGRFRVESTSGGDEHNVVCVGSLSSPGDRWLVLVPDKREFFYWSPNRGAADDRTLAGSRLFRAVMDRRYTLAGGDSLHALPSLVVSLTQFNPDPGANVRQVPPGEAKYALLEYDRVRSEAVRPWKYGPVLYHRGVHEGSFQWCPQLGVAWSSVSDVVEAPLDPSLFQVPAGYTQLFAGDAEALPRPVLAAALTQGWRSASIGAGFTYEDVDGRWGHGVALKESATHGTTGQHGYGQIHCRRIDFDSADAAEAYAEQLRATRPEGRREQVPLADYGVWEKNPTAGEASFWRHHGQLVFRRGRTVIDVAAYGYSDKDNPERHRLIAQVAAGIDRQLDGAPASPSPAPPVSPSPGDDG